jgi:hypothetical protein
VAFCSFRAPLGFVPRGMVDIPHAGIKKVSLYSGSKGKRCDDEVVRGRVEREMFPHSRTSEGTRDSEYISTTTSYCTILTLVCPSHPPSPCVVTPTLIQPRPPQAHVVYVAERVFVFEIMLRYISWIQKKKNLLLTLSSGDASAHASK